MQIYKVKLTFTKPLLGAVAKNPEVYSQFIACHAALTDEELARELETVEKVEERGWTGFHTRNGTPLLKAYVIKGFFKDACSMLRRVPDTASKKLQAHKKVTDGLIFVKPDEDILLILPEGGQMGMKERPLRGQTAQGEIVALARSDTCPAGTTMEFEIIVLGTVSEVLLLEWLDYGALRGLGGWRNAGFGTFTYELT